MSSLSSEAVWWIEKPYLRDKGRGDIWRALAAISQVFCRSFPLTQHLGCLLPLLPTMFTHISSKFRQWPPSQADLICYLIIVFPKNVLLIFLNLSL